MVLRLFCLLSLLWTVGLPVSAAYGRPYAVVVMDSKNGSVLHQVNGATPVYPASLTKMMTLYLVFEALKTKKMRLSDSVSISRRAAAQPPCKVNIRTGGTLTVKQAILAMVTKSANNIAVAMAEKLAGTEEKYAKKMSAKARVLGLKDTVFCNASGLFHPQQKTTARDMALLARALVRDFPQEYRYFNTQNFSFNGQNYRNHNHLLGKVPGVDGIKTGFVEKSGFNLVASVKRDNRRFIVVVMGAKTGKGRDNHVSELIQAAYHRPETLTLLTAKIRPQIVMASQTQEAQRQLVQRNEETSPSIDALLILAESDNRS